jgi:hypothetical protein
MQLQLQLQSQDTIDRQVLIDPSVDGGQWALGTHAGYTRK